MTKLIPLDAALAALDRHTHGKTTMGGQTYRSITLEVAFEAIRDIPTAGIRDAAQMMLELHDGFLDGRDVDMADAKTLGLASAFAAQAYAICPMRDAAPSAMTRAFLLAVIDPMHPDLDYLRAQNVARLVSDAIRAINPAAISDPSPAVAKAMDRFRQKSAEVAAAQPSTVAARWRANGQPDPHGSRYECERAALPKGDMSDDELANRMFIADRNDLDLIVWQTAAKERIRWLSRALIAALEPQPDPRDEHFDDYAVRCFAKMMAEKMAASRVKGRSGWQDPSQCSVEHLRQLLYTHLDKGDPVDVANICMMLRHYEASTAHEYESSEMAAACASRDEVIKGLVEAVEGLGAMPEGYCFCSAHRIGDDSKTHEPECRDLRAALAAAKAVQND